MTYIYHTRKGSHRTQYFLTKKDDVNHTVYAVHEIADPADPPTSENLIGHVSSIFYARQLIAACTYRGNDDGKSDNYNHLPRRSDGEAGKSDQVVFAARNHRVEP